MGRLYGVSTTGVNNTTGGRLYGGNSSTGKLDLSNPEGLVTLAQNSGIDLESELNAILDRNPKLSSLQRIGKGLGAFNPAESLLTGLEKGPLAGVSKYGTGMIQGIGSALTGTDYEGERRMFSDVAQKLGVKNTIAKFGIGVLGDIFLDPSTYIGGTLAKFGIKGLSKVAEVGLGGIGKIAPEVEQGLRMAGQGAKDSLGKAFVYGYGTSKGLPEKALEIQTNLAKTKEEIVKSNLFRLGTETLSPSQQDELVQKLLEGKKTEFNIGKGTQEGKELALNTAKSEDPLVQKTIDEQIKRSQKFAKQSGINDPYEVYFPGIKKDKIKNFLEGTKSLRVGSEGYKKEFRNLLTNENMITNPAEAFGRREFEIAKDNIVKNELQGIVRKYGKPLEAFKNEDEALKSGYKIIKEKGMFGKNIGYLNQTDKKFIDNLISPEFTTIDTIAKSTGYDAITSLFKRSVTGLFAPFHIRNYVSGMIQNYEVLGKEALNPINIAMGQKLAYKIARGEKIENKVINMGGKNVNLRKIFEPFINRFGGSSSYISDIGDATRGDGNIPGKLLGAESIKETAKTLGMGQQAIPFRIARGVGNFIETQQKAVAYITALQQGNSIKKSLELSTLAGFDYRALTPFESKIMRRIIPFYSFTRKNIELQLKTLGENPQRINQIIRLIENLGDRPSNEEKKSLPDYLLESFGIKMKDTKDGLKQYISGFGTPIEQFTQLFKGASANTFQKRVEGMVLGMISTMNPLLKVPIEIGIGKDSFRQKDLKDVYDAREYKLAPTTIKNLLNIKEVIKPVYTKDSSGKLKKTGEKTQYIADPTRLLIARSLFTSRGVTYLDQVFGGDLSGLAQFLKLTTGIKPQQVDIESQKFFKDRDKQRQLEDMLTKMGVVKTFTRAYVPKNK